MDASSVKYGPGVTRETGNGMRRPGGRRVMVVTDPGPAGSDPVLKTLEAHLDSGIDAVMFDRARVEPTDASLREAIEFAVAGRFGDHVAVGGGSSIDTAKAANLYASWTRISLPV